MTPTDFIRKWSPGGTAHELNERAGAQPHFIDLCRLLGVPEPADPEHYCFERGLVKTGSAAARTDGFAGPEDFIALTAGVPFNVKGTTNILRVAPCDERLISRVDPE